MAIELAPTPCAILVEGATGCGKTTWLIEHIATLLEAGAAPHDVLVLAATPDAARTLERCLGETCGTAARGITVTCPRFVATDLLSCEAGRAFSGRTGRIATPLEMGFIMEDMKVSGLKNRRLKEMLKFFYRSWTELVEDADGNGDWLIPGEEADVHALLKAVLDATGAVLEPEVAAMAVRFLLADEATLAAAGRRHVVVDDYQMLSRASQHLANLLARDTVAVAADAAACTEVFDSYPYAEGIGEFTRANGACERITLTESHRCAAAAAAAGRLRAEALPDEEVPAVDEAAARTSFTALATESPAAEMAAVADAVEAALAAGTAPGAVHVLAFHPAWSRQIVGALRERGIAASSPVEGRVAVGDYRDLDRCAAARLLTALALVADPRDALAWRCWCGFGDYLANSAAFADLRTAATAQGMGLAEALDALAEAADGAPTGGLGRIAAAYGEGRALLASAAGLEGDSLIAALAAGLYLDEDAAARATALARALTAPSPAETAAADAETADQSARALSERARRRMTAPVFEDEGAAVRVGGPTSVIGQEPSLLVLAGFVNGFFPTRDYFDATVMPAEKQKAARAADIRRLYAAVGKAGDRLAASWFTALDLVTAERLKLEIGRVRLRRGERIATTAPSIYLKEIAPDDTISA